MSRSKKASMDSTNAAFERYFKLELGDVKNIYETLEKPASERLMENVHPAGSAAGRNLEESPPKSSICERRI